MFRFQQAQNDNFLTNAYYFSAFYNILFTIFFCLKPSNHFKGFRTEEEKKHRNFLHSVRVVTGNLFGCEEVQNKAQLRSIYNIYIVDIPFPPNKSTTSLGQVGFNFKIHTRVSNGTGQCNFSGQRDKSSFIVLGQRDNRASSKSCHGTGRDQGQDNH